MSRRALYCLPLSHSFSVSWVVRASPQHQDLSVALGHRARFPSKLLGRKALQASAPSQKGTKHPELPWSQAAESMVRRQCSSVTYVEERIQAAVREKPGTRRKGSPRASDCGVRMDTVRVFLLVVTVDE